MKRSTTNKLNMYQRVHAAMTDHQALWQDVPALSAAMNKFTLKLGLLNERLIEQSGSTTGVTLTKELRMKNLKSRLLIVERALMLHGKAIGDTLLQERNNHSKTDLFGMNDNKLVIRCAEIKTDLDVFGDQLFNYGVSMTVAELLPLLQDIEEVKNSSWNAILKRKGATQSIKELEHSLDELINVELDNLMLVYELTQHDFYQAFVNARMIIDYHGNGPKVPKAPLEPDDGVLD